MYDKKSDPVLTDYDITINSIHQENMFKGTIAICILYSGFAFILITAAYFSDNIRDLLFDKFLPFTLVYIIGTIIIIIIFIYFILSFKPKKVDFNKIDDSISCPDYWKLEILDDTAIEKSFDTKNFNKKLFKYRCVMDDKVFNKASIYKQDKKPAGYEPLQYRLGNKPANIGGLNTGVATNYNDLYSAGQEASLNNFKDDNTDKYYYLYKNVNAYNNSNLNYTNNPMITSNILDDLKQSALIMNNYQIDDTTNYTKYTDLTNAGPNIYHTNAGNELDNRFTSNYYNSPPILTWATSNAHNDTFGKTSYRNTILTNAQNKNYTSTVYDWSTMAIPTIDNGNVYAIDLKATTGTNYILLGTIKYDNNNIRFEGIKDITIAEKMFQNYIDTSNYYFETTYVTSSTIQATVTTIPPSTYKKGPKVRLFHKTERQPEIRKEDLAKENIPLTCSAVYPSFLASKEDKYSENNTLRCAYSKICNIPWSDLHCNNININDTVK
jgi:hypothetical protein